MEWLVGVALWLAVLGAISWASIRQKPPELSPGAEDVEDPPSHDRGVKGLAAAPNRRMGRGVSEAG